MSTGGRRLPPESRRRRDEPASHAHPAPEGGLQEAARLAAARRSAIAQAVEMLYAPVLDQPLPDTHTALLERLETKRR